MKQLSTQLSLNVKPSHQLITTCSFRKNSEVDTVTWVDALPWYAPLVPSPELFIMRMAAEEALTKTQRSIMMKAVSRLFVPKCRWFAPLRKCSPEICVRQTPLL